MHFKCGCFQGDCLDVGEDDTLLSYHNEKRSNTSGYMRQCLITGTDETLVTWGSVS